MILDVIVYIFILRPFWSVTALSFTFRYYWCRWLRTCDFAPRVSVYEREL